VHAQVEIPTRLRDALDHYAWVTQLETGDHITVRGESLDSARTRRFRLAILTSEVYSTIVIEEVRYGIEGSAARVASVREVDLSAIARHFKMGAAIMGARIVRSLAPTSFRVSVGGRVFDLSHVDRSTITVTEFIDPAFATKPFFALRIAYEDSAQGRSRFEYKGATIFLAQPALLSDDDLIAVTPNAHPESGLLLRVRYRPEVGQRIAAVSAQHVGGKLALVLGSRVRDVAVIMEPVGEGPLDVGTSITGGEAEQIAAYVRTRWPSR
jgi:hypothetical protein